MVTSLDVVMVMVVLGGAYWGSVRGLLAEMVALVGVVVGIFSASNFYLTGTGILLPFLRDQQLTTFIAFLVLYLLSVLAFFLFHLVIKSNMAGGVITPFSRIVAAVIGGVKSIVFIAMVAFLIIFIWGSDNSFTSGTKFLPRILPHCQSLLTVFPEKMNEPLQEYLESIKETETAPSK